MKNLSVILLHDKMHDKQGDLVTTSLTMIDLHDISRSCRTYGIDMFYVAHPAISIRKLAQTLKSHWETGYGAEYNPNRKEAIDHAKIISNLDEAIHDLDLRHKTLPKLIATSAKNGSNRTAFRDFSSILKDNPDQPYLLMLGTGWGMSDELLNRANYFLEPIDGAGKYNHLSVRAACAIMLDRLLG